MKLNAYGKILELIKENGEWSIYHVGEGKKTKSLDVYIPAHLTQTQAIQFLEDLLHEAATPDNPSIIVIRN